jgi:excisionase family DNA binding protein
VSDSLLTTREVELLIRLNRVTIYRLIREGSFPAIKVGGQWRFPRGAVEAWLESQSSANLPPTPREEPQAGVESLFDGDEMQPILRAFSEATGLSIFITDLAGNPLLDCIECNPFCRTVQSTPEGRRLCSDLHVAIPTGGSNLLCCHAGMYYLTALVDVEGEPVARAVMGPFVTDKQHLTQVQKALPDTARRAGVDPMTLWNSLASVQEMSSDQIGILIRLLSKVVSTIAQISYERQRADLRLKEIARLAQGA